MLCDLDWGGGPGGGGGSGIPGSHLVDDEPRERDDDVLIAPVEAALREAGGRESPDAACSSSRGAGSTETGNGRRGAGTCSLLISGDSRVVSGAGRLENAEILNRLGGRSLDAARLRLDGGGGKTGFEDGSGDDLYAFAGAIRVAGDTPEAASSEVTIDAR